MSNKFSERLKVAREDNKISRRELAERLGISVRTVCFWENGERECSFDTLLNLAEIFGTTTDFLLGRTEY